MCGAAGTGSRAAALEEIGGFFENEPTPGTPEAARFDLLASIVEDYERRRWPIEPPDAIAC
jgi:HTH-type transcriptional regulator/antitoxin HigA